MLTISDQQPVFRKFGHIECTMYVYVKLDSRKQTKDANTAIQEFKGKERRSKQESNLTGAKVKIYKERQNTSFGKLDQTMP